MNPPGSAFQFPLAFIPWQIFGNVTFATVPRPRVRWGQMWRHLRERIRATGLPYQRAFIAVRHERGEQGGRPHFHYLLGGLPFFVNLKSWSFQSRHAWKTLTGAMSVVTPYDHAQPGVAYVLKGLNLLGTGGQQYELGKFGWQDNELMLSESVYRYLRCRLSLVRDGAGCTCEKTARRLEAGTLASQA